MKSLFSVVAGLVFLQYWYSNYVALHRLPHFRLPVASPTLDSLQSSATLAVQKQNDSVEKSNNELVSEEKHQPKELQVRILNLDGALLYQTELIGKTLQRNPLLSIFNIYLFIYLFRSQCGRKISTTDCGCN